MHLSTLRRCWRVLAAFAGALTCLSVATPAAEAADGSPCGAPTTRASFGPVQYCPLWMPSRGSIPVHRLDGGRVAEVGRLFKAGSVNWFVCQTDRVGGRMVRHRDSGHLQYTNVWWARTLSDTGAWGWTSEVYFAGGANDERDGRLRTCSASEAAVTGTAPPAFSAPPPASAPAPSPTPPASRRLPTVLQDGRPCTGGPRTEQGVLVNYRLFDRYVLETNRMSMGHPVTRDIWNRKGTIGSVHVVAATCPTRQGWRILPGARLVSVSYGLTAAGQPQGRAPVRNWGVAALGFQNGTLAVAMTRCYVQPSKWTGVSVLLGLPWPGPWWVSAGFWTASKFVPNGNSLRCRRLGTSNLRLGVDSRGRVTARAGDVGPVIVRTDKTHYSQYEVISSAILGRNVRRPDL